MRSGISWPDSAKAAAVARPRGHAIRSADGGIPVKAAQPGRLCAALLITIGLAALAAPAQTPTPPAPARATAAISGGSRQASGLRAAEGRARRQHTARERHRVLRRRTQG